MKIRNWILRPQETPVSFRPMRFVAPNAKNLTPTTVLTQHDWMVCIFMMMAGRPLR